MSEATIDAPTFCRRYVRWAKTWLWVFTKFFAAAGAFLFALFSAFFVVMGAMGLSPGDPDFLPLFIGAMLLYIGAMSMYAKYLKLRHGLGERRR